MSSKPKIILIFPKPRESKGKILPIPLLTLARMVNSNKYNVEIIHPTGDDSYKQKVIECGDGALCFGISSMTGYQIHDGLEIATIIKRNYPDVPIIWGGYHPSLFPEQTVQHPCVDIVVRGQGERTFQELVNCISNGQSLSEVKGITFKMNNKIISNPERPYESLDNFPPMPYHLIKNFEEFIGGKTKHGDRSIPYLSSQGCPYECAFCCQPVVCNRKWVSLSAERVVNELESLVDNYNIDCFSVVDSNFFVSKERVKKICEGIIEKNLDISLADVNARVELWRWDDDMWALMRKAGIRHLFIGAESGSQTALDLIGKGTTVEDTISIVKKCVKHDVDFQLSFMLGLPTIDIHDEIEKTLLLIDRAIEIGRGKVDVNVLFWRYAPYPGSRLYYTSIDCGFNSPQSLEGWAEFGLFEEGFETPWVPKEYWKIVRYLNFMRPYVTGNIRFDNLSPYERVLAKIWRVVAHLRWKRRSFDFPIDYKIVNCYSRMKEKGMLPK